MVGPTKAGDVMPQFMCVFLEFTAVSTSFWGVNGKLSLATLEDEERVFSRHMATVMEFARPPERCKVVYY